MYQLNLSVWRLPDTESTVRILAQKLETTTASIAHFSAVLYAMDSVA